MGSGIPSEYQGALAAKHRAWLYGGGVGCPVLTLDGSRDKSEGATTTLLSRVMEFVAELHLAKHAEPTIRCQLFGERDGPVAESMETPSMVTVAGSKHESPAKRRRLQTEVPAIAAGA